jgi:hypothetical protein
MKSDLHDQNSLELMENGVQSSETNKILSQKYMGLKKMIAK